MKILHIFTKMNYVYTEALIKMFNDNFYEDSHNFLICDVKDNVPKSIQEISKDKIYYLKNKNIKFQIFEMKKYFPNYDYIIYHFLPNDILLHIYYFFNKRLLSNVVWEIWGADLYNWRKEKKIFYLINKIREFTRKKIKYVIIGQMDILEYNRQFGDNCLFLKVTFPKGYDIDLLEKNRINKKNEVTNILVGHSAVNAVNHIEVLEQLIKFKNQNIKIILPLNYGNDSYKNKVKNFALENFDENKLQFVFEKMDLEDYIKLLWQVDIAIFHTDRQIAIGNIIMLMYMEKKIYLKKDSIMDNYYRKNESLNIYDSSNIYSEEFSDFISNFNTLNNKQFAKKEIAIKNIIKKWNETFKKLRERRI